MNTNVSPWHWFDASASTHRTAKAIAQWGPIARIELAERLGLTQGALSRITSDLIYWGVVEEVQRQSDESAVPPSHEHRHENSDETETPRRGRPKTALRLCSNKKTFIGVNIHATGMTAVAVNALCEPLEPCLSEPLTGTSVQGITEQVSKLATRCAQNLSVAPSVLAVSLGGHVVDGRTVTYAPFLHWDSEIEFAKLIEARCSLPTLIFNDLDALLLHENWFGAAVNVPRFAMVTIGSGIGYALSEGGEAVNQPDRSYGLVEHIPIDPEGPACYAGHTGCSQCLTTDSIVSEYATLIARPCSTAEFIADIDAGKPQAHRLLDRSCYRLGTFIAIMADFTMPDKVLIGGETSSLYRRNTESIRSGINSYRPTQASRIDFSIPDFSWGTWAMGAASAAIATYIE